MNEIKEIIDAISDNGITDQRLAEIREIYTILGKLLDSCQSEDRLSGDVAATVLDHLKKLKRRTA